MKSHIESLIQTHRIPGIQYVVTDANDVRFEYCGGYRDIPARLSVTPQTTFMDSRLFSDVARSSFFTPQKTNGGGETSMTLGWRIGRLSNVLYYGKPGGGPGYRSNVRIYPEQGIASVWFINETGVSAGPMTDSRIYWIGAFWVSPGRSVRWIWTCIIGRNRGKTDPDSNKSMARCGFYERSHQSQTGGRFRRPPTMQFPCVGTAGRRCRASYRVSP